MEDSLILAKKFKTSFQAHLFAARLESNGVKSFIDGDSMEGSILPLMNNSHGVSVRILKKDLKKAQAIFEEEDKALMDHLAKPPLEYAGNYYLAINGFCEMCNSSNVYSKTNSLVNWIVSVVSLGDITVVNAPFSNEEFCCDCKSHWDSYS